MCLKDVYGYVARRVPRIEDAEDVTAEVFAAALANMPRDVREPRAWLLGIARRKVADLMRITGRRPEALLPEIVIAAEGPHSEIERREAALRIREIVDSLPADQREALLLQYADELSIGEIGSVMRKSVPSVKGLLQRARATIYDQGNSFFLASSETNDSEMSK